MKILKILILLLLLSGCGLGRRYCEKYHPPTIIDTSWVDTVRSVYHDTILYPAPADSGLIEAYLECDSLGQVRLKQIMRYMAGKLTVPHLMIRNNLATFDCKVDSMKVFAIVWNKTIKIKEVKANNATIEVNKLTWWQRTQIIMCWLFFGIIAVVVGWKVLTMKTNILKYIK